MLRERYLLCSHITHVVVMRWLHSGVSKLQQTDETDKAGELPIKNRHAVPANFICSDAESCGYMPNGLLWV